MSAFMHHQVYVETITIGFDVTKISNLPASFSNKTVAAGLSTHGRPRAGICEIYYR